MNTTIVRSGQQQMNDEIGQMFKEMTDPEERERAKIRQEEAESVKLVETDAGL